METASSLKLGRNQDKSPRLNFFGLCVKQCDAHYIPKENRVFETEGMECSVIGTRSTKEPCDVYLSRLTAPQVERKR